MKECMKTHPMLHSIFGLGLGIMLASFIPGLSGSTGLILGLILAIAGPVGEILLLKKK